MCEKKNDRIQQYVLRIKQRVGMEREQMQAIQWSSSQNMLGVVLLLRNNIYTYISEGKKK